MMLVFPCSFSSSCSNSVIFLTEKTKFVENFLDMWGVVLGQEYCILLLSHRGKPKHPQLAAWAGKKPQECLLFSEGVLALAQPAVL